MSTEISSYLADCYDSDLISIFLNVNIAMLHVDKIILHINKLILHVDRYVTKK